MADQAKNPIEKAVGKRATNPPQKETTVQLSTETTVHNGDVPTPEEIMDLESLNQETVDLLAQQDPLEAPGGLEPPKIFPKLPTTTKIPPVLKPKDQTVTTTSSPESLEPPQVEKVEVPPFADKLVNPETGETQLLPPAEDPQLVLLRDYILSNGFNEACVAMHLSVICAQPLVVPSITTWAMPHYERIPAIVHKTLASSGFIETIFPALKVIMGDNLANLQWSSGIAISLTFFSVIQTLPYLLMSEAATKQMETEG